MSLTIQKGFWSSKAIGDTRNKLTELYYEKPKDFKTEKGVILEFWLQCEGLTEVLGDKLNQFVSWFYQSTSTETITRCLRSLKEDGTIELSSDDRRSRVEREQNWRSYWGNGGNGETK